MKKTILHLSIILAVVGCADQTAIPPTMQAPAAPSNASESNSADVVTFLDSPELQDGPGLVDDDASKEFISTDSGLKYRVLRKSDGAKPTASNSVTVNYRGWLDDGTKFDGCYGDTPISFPLSGVIAGWTEGLQLVGVGGMIELWIPSDLGYGARGSGNSIPPNSPLHFIVELLEVE